MSFSGYIVPAKAPDLPRGLTLNQFIQTVFVGITALPGDLVRPSWQLEPPKQPDACVNWLALGIDNLTPDANGYLDSDANGIVSSQRHETLEVKCSIYGPAAIEIADLIRDGFQIPGNLEALRSANMGFVNTSTIMHFPDLVNGRYINRILMSVFLRREIQRVYPILTLISAGGEIHTVIGDELYLKTWET